jgi:electron transfer flavoprotein beta subunit
VRVIVCVKQVPDPEGARESYEVDAESLVVEPKGITPVLSPFDENALEAAMRLKDEDPDGVQVILLSAGERLSPNFVLKALAVGADEMVKVEDELFEAQDMDSLATACSLARAIEKMGDYDLILAGRQAADLNAGQTPIMLAEQLGIPAITFAREIDVDGDKVTVKKALSEGYQVEKAEMPLLIMVNNDYGAMRYPSINKMREAKGRPTTTWSAEDIGIEEHPEKKIVLRELQPPEIKGRDCLIVEGETPDEAGRNLAQKLRADGII